MLIRLVAHAHKGNPNLIDELIRIDGLPDNLLYHFKDGKCYLMPPWEPDIDANIPKHIREHCQRVEITRDLPPERNEITGVMQRPSDTFTILGVKINLDNTPGKEMWAQIERILDMGTPRDRKVPTPRVVAPNQKDAFFLDAEDIPVCDLRPPKIEVPVTTSEAVKVEIPVAPVPAPAPAAPPVHRVYTCGVCQKSFVAERGLWMHERKMRHKVQEPVAVGG